MTPNGIFQRVTEFFRKTDEQDLAELPPSETVQMSALRDEASNWAGNLRRIDAAVVSATLQDRPEIVSAIEEIRADPDRVADVIDRDARATAERGGFDFETEQGRVQAFKALNAEYEDAYIKAYFSAENLPQHAQKSAPDEMNALPEDAGLRDATIRDGVQAEIARYSRLGYSREAIGGQLVEIQEQVEERVAQAVDRGEPLGSWQSLVEADTRAELAEWQAEADLYELQEKGLQRADTGAVLTESQAPARLGVERDLDL